MVQTEFPISKKEFDRKKFIFNSLVAVFELISSSMFCLKKIKKSGKKWRLEMHKFIQIKCKFPPISEQLSGKIIAHVFYRFIDAYNFFYRYPTWSSGQPPSRGL